MPWALWFGSWFSQSILGPILLRYFEANQAPCAMANDGLCYGLIQKVSYH